MVYFNFIFDTLVVTEYIIITEIHEYCSTLTETDNYQLELITPNNIHSKLMKTVEL